VELEALGAGTHRQSLVWQIADDGYPDCFVEKKVIMEVEFTVPNDFPKWIWPTVAVLGSLLTVLVVGSSARFLYKRHGELKQLQKDKVEWEKNQVNLAKSMLDTMAFPIHLVLANTFLARDQLTVFEVLRDEGLHKVIDQVKDLGADEFGNVKSSFVFFSHQWTGFTEPDANNRQFRIMCDSLKDLMNRSNDKWHPKNLFVWVDYSCIPQRHKNMQELAIMSLPVYSSKASMFVIIAPEVEHQDTCETCNLDTYNSRAWCRTEQASHSLCRGAKHLYIATKEGEQNTQSLEFNMLKEALRVFDGNLTCCRLKHRGMEQCDKQKLVLPMLSVYANLLRQEKLGSNKRMSSMLSHEADRFFPSHFDFVKEKSIGGAIVTERRPLFGDLVEKMKQEIQAEDEEEIANIPSIRPIWSSSTDGSVSGVKKFSDKSASSVISPEGVIRITI